MVQGLLWPTVGHRPRFVVPHSAAQDEVCYSTHLPNLKSIASSISEILKEFKICIQTDSLTRTLVDGLWNEM